MARGGRNSNVEEERMRSMQQYTYTGGRQGSGPAMNQKPAYDKPAVSNKSPKSARKP